MIKWQQNTPGHRKIAQSMSDVGTTTEVSDYVPTFVEAGVHPLLALVGLQVMYPMARKARQVR